MTLRRLLNKPSLIILGLNSGTSADGLDMAVLRLSTSLKKHPIFIAGDYCPYPAKLREKILKVADCKSIELDDLLYLNNLLGIFYGECADRLIKKLTRKGIAVDAIASHGQTVRHLPRHVQYHQKRINGTLQLGSLEHIASITGKITVGDFRQADIAIGNEGAPITVAAMADLFSHPTQPRLIINIGGMANYFFFPAQKAHGNIHASDCGPGNSLSDILCQKLFHKPYDKNGMYASRGTISPYIMDSILKNSFFSGKTSSTGREIFGEQMANRLLSVGKKHKLTSYDILASTAEATIYGIRHAINPFLWNEGITKLYLTGGGIHNSFLVQRMNETLKPVKAVSIAELGFNPDLVEASSYAVMGFACLHSKPLPTVFKSGIKQHMLPVLGKIVQPSVKN